MKATAILLAVWLASPVAALAQTEPSTPAPAEAGEPLPPGAPSAPYELSAWCYGALSEYLDIYDRVLPDLRDIDKMFGSSEPNEAEPYADDMAEARKELVVLGGAVEAAEKASDRPIQSRGAAAVKQGRNIWAPAEMKARRELARAWLSWALPDRCDSTARTLAANAAVLGAALKFNTPAPDAAPAVPATPASDSAPAASGPAAGPEVAADAPAKPPASDPAASPTSETAPAPATPATQPPAASEPTHAPTPTPIPSTTPAPEASPTPPPPTETQPGNSHPPM